MQQVVLGKTGLRVSKVGFGAAAIGGLYGRHVSEDQGVSTTLRALELGMTLIDTAPKYGCGQSETYVGKALEAWDGPRPVISTKVGEHPAEYDYSYSATMSSIEDSLGRLGIDHLDIVHLHAVQKAPAIEYVLSSEGAYGALRRLQAEGVIGWLGVGCPTPAIYPYVASGKLEAALVANQYDLLNQSAADKILPSAMEQDMGVIVGGAYGTGILATGISDNPKYFYRDASEEVIKQVKQYDKVCQNHGVSLKAAALHYVLKHPAVHCVVLGTSKAAHVEEMADDADTVVADDLWQELEELVTE